MGMSELMFHCVYVVGETLLDIRKLVSQVVELMLSKLKEHFMKSCKHLHIERF